VIVVISNVIMFGLAALVYWVLSIYYQIHKRKKEKNHLFVMKIIDSDRFSAQSNKS
jgi:hypothetical protein